MHRGDEVRLFDANFNQISTIKAAYQVDGHHEVCSPNAQQVSSVEPIHLISCLNGGYLIEVGVKEPDFVSSVHSKAVVIAPDEFATRAEVYLKMDSYGYF